MGQAQRFGHVTMDAESIEHASGDLGCHANAVEHPVAELMEGSCGCATGLAELGVGHAVEGGEEPIQVGGSSQGSDDRQRHGFVQGAEIDDVEAGHGDAVDKDDLRLDVESARGEALGDALAGDETVPWGGGPHHALEDAVAAEDAGDGDGDVAWLVGAVVEADGAYLPAGREQ